MFLELLRDPEARRTYLLVKALVLVVAALATWPLARVIGPRAWVGLAVFAVVIALLTAAVLVAARAGAPAAVADPGDGGDADELDPDRAVAIPVEGSLDLHPFPPADIPAVVASYLEEAHRAGFREVRLIHGRGIGVQRERVRSTLARHPLVRRFADAPPERGGWGATVAELGEPD